MKLFKYLLSLAFVCICMFSVSYAQSKKVVKPTPKGGVVYEIEVKAKSTKGVIYNEGVAAAAKSNKTAKTNRTVGNDKKCVKCDVHPLKENKSKSTLGRKKEVVKP